MQKRLDNYGSFVTFNFFNMSKNRCVWKIPSKVLPLEIYGFDRKTNLWENQCWNKIQIMTHLPNYRTDYVVTTYLNISIKVIIGLFNKVN
jgi:hypothetical protein